MKQLQAKHVLFLSSHLICLVWLEDDISLSLFPLCPFHLNHKGTIPTKNIHMPTLSSAEGLILPHTLF